MFLKSRAKSPELPKPEVAADQLATSASLVAAEEAPIEPQLQPWPDRECARVASFRNSRVASRHRRAGRFCCWRSVEVKVRAAEQRCRSQRNQPFSKHASSESTAASPTASAANAALATTTGSTDVTSEPNSAGAAPATSEESSKFPHVTGVRHWSSPDSSTVVLDLEDQVQYEAHRLTGPDRIYFDLHDTQLSSDLSGKAIEIGDTLISRVRLAQPVAGMTRIVLETKANTNFSVSLESNPYRLIVEVRKVGSAPKGAVNLFPNAPTTETSKLAIVIPPPTKEDLQFRARVPKMRIVVDAGHGGWDLGTVGPSRIA